jgi:hypothetical protein
MTISPDFLMSIANPEFIFKIVKGVLAIINLIFAIFVFQHLRDLQQNYHSKLYIVFQIIWLGFFIVSILFILIALS